MGYGSKEAKTGAPSILRHMKGDFNNMVIKHDEKSLGRGGHLGSSSPNNQWAQIARLGYKVGKGAVDWAKENVRTNGLNYHDKQKLRGK